MRLVQFPHPLHHVSCQRNKAFAVALLLLREHVVPCIRGSVAEAFPSGDDRRTALRSHETSRSRSRSRRRAESVEGDGAGRYVQQSEERSPRQRSVHKKRQQHGSFLVSTLSQSGGHPRSEATRAERASHASAGCSESCGAEHVGSTVVVTTAGDDNCNNAWCAEGESYSG